MLVSHKFKFIYLKTKKTGGTSVQIALYPHLGPQDVVVDVHPKEGHDYQERNNLNPNFHTHEVPSKIIQKLGRDVWDQYDVIANIRNPWDRWVSLFHYQQPIGFNSKTKNIFEVWLLTQVGRHNNIEFMFHPNGEPTANKVIRYERLQEGYDSLCDDYKINRHKLPRTKARQRQRFKSIPYSAYYTDKSKRLVYEVEAPLIELYNYKF